MHRRLTLLIAFLLALPLAAQTKHLVSRIEVRGDVPVDIVTSQSALVEGQSYSDRDLEIAVGRLRRLPFVYDARYTIEGETLIIDIAAVSRFSADVDALGNRFQHEDRGDAKVGGVGRLFLGSGGVARGRVGGIFTDGNDAGVVDAEYAQYGIGGTRLFAVAGVSAIARNDDRVETDPTWRLTVGYPLSLRQTLKATAVGESFSSHRTIPILDQTVESYADRKSFGLQWTFDTTEDPFFARHGEVINVSPTWTNEDSLSHGLVIFAPDGPVEILSTRTDGTGTIFGFDATKYWSVGNRGAIVSSIATSFENRDIEYRLNGGELRNTAAENNIAVLSVGYAFNLFDWNAPIDATRQRLEFGVAASRREISQSNSFRGTFDETSFTAGYALRKQFATVRLSLSYTMTN